MTVQLVDESQASGSDMPLMRLTVSQYHVLTGMGFFDSEPGVELLEGYVVNKMAKRPAHTLAKRLLAASLRQQIPVGFFVAEEDPLTLADSEPEPDLMVVRGHPQDFASRNVTPAEVLLVVEVADSTLDRDRKWKTGIYAKAGVLRYLVINIPERLMEFYSTPDETRYSRHQRFDENTGVTLDIGGVFIELAPVNQLLA